MRFFFFVVVAFSCFHSFIIKGGQGEVVCTFLRVVLFFLFFSTFVFLFIFINIYPRRTRGGESVRCLVGGAAVVSIVAAVAVVIIVGGGDVFLNLCPGERIGLSGHFRLYPGQSLPGRKRLQAVILPLGERKSPDEGEIWLQLWWPLQYRVPDDGAFSARNLGA